ncbi:MAG: DNA polymerase IV [Tannerellaceae bacterium]|nr:DNA polymerase IV [Tannerellaceae bacterium]
MRKIIHIDMDAFYASIEQRDHPEYRGKPLAVGYAGDRGVVAAASYEARRYGVRSAMASKTALKKCPHLIFAASRFDVYRTVSRQIMNIFLEYTDLVEPLSLDEAFLDVTVNHKQIKSAIRIAREIKIRIKEETGLTASAGVSVNKFLAKIASDYQKPDGLFVILEKDAEAFVESLQIEQFYGVGKVTAEKMHRLGIHTGADLKARSESELIRLFGKAGHIYYNQVRGIDNRLVTPDHTRKSLGAENTFLTDLSTLPELREELKEIAETVWKRIKEKNFQGRTVTLKVKYADFEQITRSKTLLDVITEYELFYRISIELLEQIDFTTKPIRLIGLTISNPKETTTASDYIQLELDFRDPED